MSLSIVYTRASVGIDAPPVVVETHLSSGLPSFAIVGLPEKGVKESKDRVRSAIQNSGFDFPNRRITVNLAPADLAKQGGRYDLAIALGILAASRQIDQKPLADKEFLGELALTGEVRSIKGLIPSAMATLEDGRHLYLPVSNRTDAALIGSPNLSLVSHLNELLQHLRHNTELPSIGEVLNSDHAVDSLDLRDVIGQHRARRALEVAAAGGLNLLFYGPPGTGKSMLAQRLPGIMPPLSKGELLEVAALQSLSRDGAIGYPTSRPFRAPHHTSTAVAMVGGGNTPMPGEVSLAHHGVLFLDELPEFGRQVLEVLREPIESGRMNIARANYSTSFPARFQLLAAMNPCPCGNLGHPHKPCTDSPSQIENYRRKLSGPLLDRLDMHVEVNFQSSEVLLTRAQESEPSALVRQRVMAARKIQEDRQGKPNASLSTAETERICYLHDPVKSKLIRAIDKLSLSARSIHRLLRVGRTLADLEAKEHIEFSHLAEALSYRMKD